MDEIIFTPEFSLSPETDEDVKWQPLMVLVIGKRIECDCGNQAIFVIGKSSEKVVLEDVEAFCQDCFSSRKEDE
jgi:hypothetical protein